MRCLALDFGGSAVKYAVVNDQAEIEISGKAPAPTDSLAHFLHCIECIYRQFAGKVDGIALSLPGVIDVEKGIHCGSGAYASLLKGRCVTSLVSERCGVRVSAENDGKCGALAELWGGELRGAQDGAVLILGTSVGGGVITKGSIQRGAEFSAGEFSYMVTEPEQWGILSQVWMNVGVVGMTYKLCKLKNIDLAVQDAGSMLMQYDALMASRFPSFQTAPKKLKVDGRQIFHYLEAGDHDAQVVYEQFLHSLALLVHSIQLCNAPEKIVIGGGLSQVERLLPDLQAELERLYEVCLVPASAQAHLCKSRYLDECNLLGAAYHFLNTFGGVPHVS